MNNGPTLAWYLSNLTFDEEMPAVYISIVDENHNPLMRFGADQTDNFLKYTTLSHKTVKTSRMYSECADGAIEWEIMIEKPIRKRISTKTSEEPSQIYEGEDEEY